MKIDHTTGSTTAARLPAKAAGTAVARAASPAPAVDSARIHQLPAAGEGDFDAARVAAIREDIRAGRYQFHPERIADGLLASVRELLAGSSKP